MELENLKALVEADTTIPMASQQIFLNGNRLSNEKYNLKDLGVKQDDILLIRRTPQPSASGPSSQAGSRSGAGAAVGNAGSSLDAQVEQLRQSLILNPQALAQIASQQPEVAAAALNDPARFKQLMTPLLQGRQAQEAAKMREMAALHSADPFDMEVQKKIEEMIKLKNIQENLEAAMENNPEAFGSVVMLYIDTEVNGKSVKAFVDSGAQTTIMSPDCAEFCGIMHLCDTRFAGIAKGVGTAKILGRVHATTLKIGDAKKNMFLQCSVTIMEGKGVDMLLGLDMLKRFQACIDLSKNVLRIGDFETPFLSEKDLPDKARKFELPSPTAEESSSKTPQQPAQPVSAPAPSASSGALKHPEEYIANLMALGATREQAINALDAANGNVEIAAGLIFS